jgi:hypothetical protein
MSAITNISWTGSAAETYGAPYSPSPEEKEARQAADQARAERNRKAAQCRREREQNVDFRSLKGEITEHLRRWFYDGDRLFDYSVKEIKAAVIDYYAMYDVHDHLVGQAATSAIAEFLDLDFTGKLQEKREAKRQAEKARLDYGFKWSNSELLGGKYRIAPFTYQGLRSNEHFWLERFNAITHSLRSGKYASANNKEFAGAYEADSKLLALDDAWIDVNKDVIGMMRQDIDATFMSWDHLRQEIADRNLPLPHLAVAHVDDQGAVHNPHVLWFLPKNMGVRTDAKAFDKPQKLYKAVMRGLCNELMPLGADPGALTNACRVKNPLSPLWKICVMSEEQPLSLAAWADIVDTEVYFEPLMRDYSTVRAVRDGADATASNQAYMTLKRAAFQLVMSWYQGGDSRFVADNREITAGHIVDELGSMARHVLLNGSKPQASMAILQRVATYTAENFDIEKAASYRANKGILSEILPEEMPAKARMAEGGRYSAGKRAEETLMAMVEAAVDIELGEKNLSKGAIMDATGLGRATVHRKWAAMLEKLSDESLIQAIVRKREQSRSSIESSLFTEEELNPSRERKECDQATWDSMTEVEKDGNIVLAFRVLGAIGAIEREKNRKLKASEVESHSGYIKKAGTIPDSSKDSPFALDHTVSVSQQNTLPDGPVSPSNDNDDHGLNSWLAWHSDCPVDDIIETDLLIPEAA